MNADNFKAADRRSGSLSDLTGVDLDLMALVRRS